MKRATIEVLGTLLAGIALYALIMLPAFLLGFTGLLLVGYILTIVLGLIILLIVMTAKSNAN